MESRARVSRRVSALALRIAHMISVHADKAIMAYNKKFDNSEERLLRVATASSLAGVDIRSLFNLKAAYDRIVNFHSRQLPMGNFYRDELGAKLGSKWVPLASVGVYVPGGTASYFSSVLMSCVPAKIAGVKSIYLVTPFARLTNEPLFRACAAICGVACIYTFGGAQAIAALALGTNAVARVDKIVGPGNAYVAAAKRLLYGAAGTDCIAGPSEAVLIIDRSVDVWGICVDASSQLEHDKSALAVVITRCASLASEARAKVVKLAAAAPRSHIMRRSWSAFGISMICCDTAAAASAVKLIAAEHVQVCTRRPLAVLKKLTAVAGGVFAGANASVAIGDYMGGMNHTLPTATSARFGSGLSVFDFIRRTSMIWLPTRRPLKALAAPSIACALSEGLHGHALSIANKLWFKH
ncbi:MAG: histidinol dehydrogenase [Candidatus Hodgkinia cicadicola]